MSWTEIQQIEKNMYELASQLEKLRKEVEPKEVKNYIFETLNGESSLLDLFGQKEKLLLIHNMGQGCRWCTAWGDALNGILPHLESEFAVVLVSKDAPEIQRNFALSRKWNFVMASHGGGKYILEQSTQEGEKNMPGIVCFERKGEQIFKKNFSTFGPGDVFNPLFHILTLGGISMEKFTPQYSYWKYPDKMEDGSLIVDSEPIESFE